jgi:putative FmdB family regulatory protein
MPLYEYDCRKCKKRFTIILRMAELGKGKSVRCPRCSSTDVHKCIEPFFAVTAKKS